MILHIWVRKLVLMLASRHPIESGKQAIRGHYAGHLTSKPKDSFGTGVQRLQCIFLSPTVTLDDFVKQEFVADDPTA
jgi:hypothetical protein